MANTTKRTYSAEHNGGQATRTTATKAYTHTVWLDQPADGSEYLPGCLRWSESEANAEKYAKQMRAKGHAMSVVPCTLQGQPAAPAAPAAAPAAADALAPGLAATDKAIADGVAEGLSTDLAIERALLRTSKGLAAAWAQGHGTKVAKSWSKERIAAEAARTERNRARQHSAKAEPKADAGTAVVSAAITDILTGKATAATVPATVAAVAKAKAERKADAEPEGTFTATGAYTDRAKRLKAAKVEGKTLAEWRRSGTNGRPVTPNLDAIEAESAEAKAPTGAKVAAPAAPAAKAARKLSGSERGQQARKVKREQGKRGPGRKMDTAEFLAYVANVRAEHPEDSRSDAMEFAYWVDGIAFSRPAWNKAWEAAEG